MDTLFKELQVPSAQQKVKTEGASTSASYIADDLYCAVDLLVILSDPASDPVQRKRAEKWQRTEFFKLPAELRSKAIEIADVRVFQRGV